MAAIDLLLTLVVLCLFGLFLGFAYRNRASIKKWLNTPYYAEDDRKLKLQRRIEDAQHEIADIDKKEAAAEKAEAGEEE